MRLNFYLDGSNSQFALRVWTQVPRIGEFVMLNHGAEKKPFVVIGITYDESDDRQEANLVVRGIKNTKTAIEK